MAGDQEVQWSDETPGQAVFPPPILGLFPQRQHNSNLKRKRVIHRAPKGKAFSNKATRVQNPQIRCAEGRRAASQRREGRDSLAEVPLHSTQIFVESTHL